MVGPGAGVVYHDYGPTNPFHKTQALGTLLTDLNPDQPSTAAASANIVRCVLAAGALAALQPIIDAVGAGWCFTIFGVLCGLCVPLMFLEMHVGHLSRQVSS